MNLSSTGRGFDDTPDASGSWKHIIITLYSGIRKNV